MSYRPRENPLLEVPPMVETLEDRTLLSATWTGVDADGDLLTVKLSGPGSLVVTPATGGGIDTIQFSGTSAKTSALSVAVKKAGGGDGYVDIASILAGDASAGLKAINAGKVDLLGSATGTGLAMDGQLSSLTMHDVLNGADITVGPASTFWDPALRQNIKVTLNSVSDFSSLHFAGNVTKLTAGEVSFNTDVSAAAIGSMKVAGQFGGNLTLQGNLGGAAIGGWVGGVWDIGGSGGKIMFGASYSDWSVSFGGDVKSVTAKSTMAFTDWTSRSIGSLSAESMLSGQMNLTGATNPTKLTLGGMKVKTWMDGATVLVNGNAGAVTVGGMRGSNVLLGTQNGVQAMTVGAAASDYFASPFTLKKFTVTGAIDPLNPTSGSMVDSLVMASTIGRAAIRNVQLDNGGTPFGLAARSLGKVTVQQPVGQGSSHFTTYTLGRNWIMASPSDFLVQKVV